jgi:general secretion pathway protein K
MKRQGLGEQGVALALVLWLVVLLGATAASVATSTRSGSGVILNARARTVARAAAESGIVTAVALLERRMAGAYTPAQRALAFAAADHEFADLREVSLGQARFSVELTNLSGRLDLNQADPGTLVGLFSQFTSPTAARGLVAALEDWRDVDSLVRPQGAEHQAYLRAGSPYVPTNAPLNRLDELGRVRGASDALVRAVAPYVTVNGDLLIDVNAASETVLAAVPGIGTGGARTLISQRRRGGAFLSIMEVQRLLGAEGGRSGSKSVPGLTIAPSRLLLVSRGWMSGHPLTHEIQAAYAVVGQQLRLQSWRERDL